MNKHFLDEKTLIEDAFRLAVQVYESGFRPTFIVGLWRGGSSVGIYVQECLQVLGITTDHISLRTSYRGQPAYEQMIAAPGEQIRVHGTQYLLENLNASDQLLIVDDVFSSGANIQAVIDRLQQQAGRVAVLWQRKKQRRTALKPDYCLYETEDWLVFPYEMQGLSRAEIAKHKPYLMKIMEEE